MAPFTLAPFRQGALLTHETDPEVAGGICVALCDTWLDAILSDPSGNPADRMQAMSARFAESKSRQKQYGVHRATLGREAARQAVGGGLGLDFDAQTTVMRVFVGQQGMLKRLEDDLRIPGASATWSMRFGSGGGHAIAGANVMRSVASNIHVTRAHLFDPNVGEYETGVADLQAVLADLFARVPRYQTTNLIHRMDVRR